MTKVCNSTHPSNLWITSDRDPIKLFEDNVACVAQMNGGYIKSDRAKYISPKFSFMQELENNKTINIQYIRSSDNASSLHKGTSTTLKKLIRDIEMRHLRNL